MDKNKRLMGASWWERLTVGENGSCSDGWGHAQWILNPKRPTRLSRTNIKKDVLFIIGDWNTKVGSQGIPGITGKLGLGGQSEAGQKLKAFCQENPQVIANTLFQQPKKRLYTWTSPDGQYWNQLDYILSSWRWRRSISSVQLSSVAQSCPTLCDPMNHSMPGLPVHHQLPKFTQTHVHRVSDAIHFIFCCPLLLLPPIPPSIRVFFIESTLCMG